MQRTIKLETHFLIPPYKIEEEIIAYGDQQNRTTNVNADVTHWHVHKDNKFNFLVDYIHEIYPTHTIEELWGCTYRQGNFTKTHNHYGFDRGFVWFVDTSATCSPLIFPDPEHPWMPPIHVIQPKKGTIVVFSGQDLHYVPPQINGYTRVVMSGNMRLNTTVSTENDATQP
tara:strand:+ start:424 stop:936 length:513 start_codon:yes stop_codon:yes gene_type:complete